MGEPALATDTKLELARSLVEHLEQGANDDALTLIAKLAGFRDSLLFQEVGRLTRELHDSINGFVIDSNIADIAQSEMPDAAERLGYVIQMTEDGANTTLGAVESAMPLAETLQKDSQHLAESWQKFNARQLTVDDFRELSGELSVRVKLENFQIKGRGLSGVQELVEATGNLLNHGVSLVSGESAAVTATLPDGDVIGQQKLVYVTNVDNAVVLSVTSHGTSDPESFTAGAAGQSLLLVWDGTVWQTVAGNLPTT